MAERIIKVGHNDFYRPIHDKTFEEFTKIGKKYEYNADERAEASKWDFFRHSDDTYRFNVELQVLVRMLDERDDTEYLTRVWRVYGKSEIGNEMEFIKQFAIDTYYVPKYKTNVVQAKGSQSLKTEAGEVTKLELRYSTPFTIDNVFAALKDSMPENNLRYVTLYAETHQGRKVVPMEKKYFVAWLLAPMEFLAEYNKTGNKGLVEIDLDNLPRRYKDKVNEFQLEKIKKILTDSNVVFLDEEEKQAKELEEKQMMAQGVSNEQPKTVEKVKVKTVEKAAQERDVY